MITYHSTDDGIVNLKSFAHFSACVVHANNVECYYINVITTMLQCYYYNVNNKYQAIINLNSKWKFSKYKCDPVSGLSYMETLGHAWLFARYFARSLVEFDLITIQIERPTYITLVCIQYLHGWCLNFAHMYAILIHYIHGIQNIKSSINLIERTANFISLVFINVLIV